MIKIEENEEIIRKVDELGRIVLPIQIRNECKIVEKDEIKISVEGTRIILEKYKKQIENFLLKI